MRSFWPPINQHQIFHNKKFGKPLGLAPRFGKTTHLVCWPSSRFSQGKEVCGVNMIMLGPGEAPGVFALVRTKSNTHPFVPNQTPPPPPVLSFWKGGLCISVDFPFWNNG